MSKLYLSLALLFILSACRKDDSAFVKPNNGSGKCLIAKSGYSMPGGGSAYTTWKYELDSIPVELRYQETGQPDEVNSLQIETPTKFIYYQGTKSPQNAKTRIYLNADGSINKEIALTLNPDGKTFTEDPSQQNLFYYDGKKRVNKIDVSIDDKGIYDFTYDAKGLVSKIVLSDGNGTDYFIYDNITHDTTHKKNDNFFAIQLFESLSSYFIPNLRASYIKTYKLYSPLSPSLTYESELNYKFSGQKLSNIDYTFTSFGITQTLTLDVTLNCKD